MLRVIRKERAAKKTATPSIIQMQVKPSTPANAHSPSTLLCGMKRYCGKNELMSSAWTISMYSCPKPMGRNEFAFKVTIRLKFSMSRVSEDRSDFESRTDRTVFTGLKMPESEFHPAAR